MVKPLRNKEQAEFSMKRPHSVNICLWLVVGVVASEVAPARV